MPKTFYAKRNKPFYADFATRAFRFYVRNPDSPDWGCNEADVKSWAICREIYAESTDSERRIIDAVFGFRLPMQAAVSYAAALAGESERKIWCVIRRKQKDFASRRGLR